MARAFLSTLNRPPGRLFARLRIDRPLDAYALCGIAATATVAAVHVAVMAWNLTRLGGWPEFDWPDYVLSGTLIWAAITIAGLVVAGPFVAAATWLGRRFGFESALYYAATGAISASALVLLLLGPPRPGDFDTALAGWLIVPPCAAAWGAAWWYLHRRWQARP